MFELAASARSALQAYWLRPQRTTSSRSYATGMERNAAAGVVPAACLRCNGVITMAPPGEFERPYDTS